MALSFHNSGGVIVADRIEGDVNTTTNINPSAAGKTTVVLLFLCFLVYLVSFWYRFETTRYDSVKAQPHSEPDPIYFNVRRPETNFVGRSSELRMLEDLMQVSPDSLFTKPQTVVISGLGGIGKTQLVRRFIEENRSIYKNVIWINAEKPQAVKDSFTKLAEDWLKISTTHPNGKRKDTISVIEQVFTKLCKRKTLFVYDNVDNIESINFLLTIETSLENPSVVITSRIREWGDEIAVIHLNTWHLDEAIKYVSITLKNPRDSDDDKKLLVQTLQAIPLALRQATAHINYQRKVENFQISDYVAKHHTPEMLNSTIFKRAAGNLYERTTFATWKITIDAIERENVNGEMALRLLYICAYFDAENIHRDIFKHLDYDMEKIKLAVRLLINYSMLDSQDNIQTTLSVHRLVQKVIQLHLQEKNLEIFILVDALELISLLMDEDRETVITSLTHAMSVFLSALRLSEIIEEFSELPYRILLSSIELGKYNQAKAFSDEIQQPMMATLGENHKHMLETKFVIGRLYIFHGLYSEALEILTNVYDKQRLILGEDDPDTLNTRSNIAFSLQNLKRLTEALQIVEDVYDKRKIISGEDHPETLTALSSIASALIKLGRFTEALKIDEEVYDKRRIILGEDHPDTLTARSNVAFSYSELERHTEALQIDEDVYDKRKIILGEDHPDTLAIRLNIAFSYTQLGRLIEALQIYEDVYEKEKIILGEDHPDTLTSRSFIAFSYSQLGRDTEALQIYEYVYDKRKIILGEDHKHTLKTRENILFLYRELERFTEALQVYEDIYDRQQIILEEDHPVTLESRSNIAFSNSQLGRHTEALQIYEDIYDKQKIILGEDHLDTLETRSNIAFSYSQLGRYTEALPTYKDIYDKEIIILGEDHPNTITTKSNIAFTYKQLGRLTEALQMYEDIYEKEKIILGEDHPITLRTKSKLFDLSANRYWHVIACFIVAVITSIIFCRTSSL